MANCGCETSKTCACGQNYNCNNCPVSILESCAGCLLTGALNASKAHNK